MGHTPKVDAVISQVMRYTYNGTLDAQLKTHSGCECEIVRALTCEEADLEETGPMFRVRFKDGFESDVYRDELTGLRFYTTDDLREALDAYAHAYEEARAAIAKAKP